MTVQFVFFDIGGTLGERDPVSGAFSAYESSARLLEATQKMGLGIGIITTLGSLTNQDAWQLLTSAGLGKFITPNALLSEHDTSNHAKPEAVIYREAAQRVGIPIGSCLFVGENLIEVMGAMAAGMQAQLKPSPPGRELAR